MKIIGHIIGLSGLTLRPMVPSRILIMKLQIIGSLIVGSSFTRMTLSFSGHSRSFS